MSNVCLNLCSDSLRLHLTCSFPSLRMSESLVKVIDLSIVKAGGNPSMTACVQVRSTDFREVMLDGDSQDHTWLGRCRAAPWGIFSQMFIPIAAVHSGQASAFLQGRYSSWQNKRQKFPPHMKGICLCTRLFFPSSPCPYHSCENLVQESTQQGQVQSAVKLTWSC